MMRMMERRNRQSAAPALAWALLAAVLFVLPLLTACGGSSHNPAAGQTVEVHLNEGQIQMPSSVPSGKTVFKLVNDGTAAHGFEIEGPGGDKSVPSVEPGQTASLEMILDPGTYRVLCAVDGNRERGMQMALNVT